MRFHGTWGFQSYLESAGLRKLDRAERELPAGSVLIVAELAGSPLALPPGSAETSRRAQPTPPVGSRRRTIRRAEPAGTGASWARCRSCSVHRPARATRSSGSDVRESGSVPRSPSARYASPSDRRPASGRRIGDADGSTGGAKAAAPRWSSCTAFRSPGLRGRRSWRSLRDRFTCILPDLDRARRLAERRRRATTRRPDRPPSSRALLRHLGVDSYALVGNDTGGWIARELALLDARARHPPRAHQHRDSVPPPAVDPDLSGPRARSGCRRGAAQLPRLGRVPPLAARLRRLLPRSHAPRGRRSGRATSSRCSARPRAWPARSASCAR